MDVEEVFTRTLKHNSCGDVDIKQLNLWFEAIRKASDGYVKEALDILDKIVYEGTLRPLGLKDYLEIISKDNSSLCKNYISPSFKSNITGADLIEVYGAVIIRDIPFIEWESNRKVKKICTFLNNTVDYQGPKNSCGKVTPNLFLRDLYLGALNGPFISQFLLINKKAIPKDLKNYYITESELIQNFSGIVLYPRPMDELSIYPYNLRSTSWQLQFTSITETFSDLFVYLETLNIKKQINISKDDAIKIWSQLENSILNEILKIKWFNFRQRPDQHGFLVNKFITQNKTFKLPQNLLRNGILPYYYKLFNNYLISQVIFSGAPNNPSFVSDIAALISGVITFIKAIFYTHCYSIPIYIPNSDGTDKILTRSISFITYELDKLASNYSFLRIAQGAHHRSDLQLPLDFGEYYTINYLKQLKLPFYLQTRNGKLFT